MCALGYYHKATVTIEFYTSHKMDDVDFDMTVVKELVMAKNKINEIGQIRCHVKRPRFEHFDKLQTE